MAEEGLGWGNVEEDDKKNHSWAEVTTLELDSGVRHDEVVDLLRTGLYVLIDCRDRLVWMYCTESSVVGFDWLWTVEISGHDLFA